MERDFFLFHIFPCSSLSWGTVPDSLCISEPTSLPRMWGPAQVFVKRFERGLRQRNLEVFEMTHAESSREKSGPLVIIPVVPPTEALLLIMEGL